MRIETRFGWGDRVRIVAPVARYGAAAEGLGVCVVTVVMVAASEGDQRERYTLRCAVPADPMAGTPASQRMIYEAPGEALAPDVAAVDGTEGEGDD